MAHYITYTAHNTEHTHDLGACRPKVYYFCKAVVTLPFSQHEYACTFGDRSNINIYKILLTDTLNTFILEILLKIFTIFFLYSFYRLTVHLKHLLINYFRKVLVPLL